MNPSSAELATALSMSSFENLQAEEKSSGFRERPEAATAGFFRAGKAEQWREVLTPAQVDGIVTGHRLQMEKFGYLPL
jgi:hypothetical protein